MPELALRRQDKATENNIRKIRPFSQGMQTLATLSHIPVSRSILKPVDHGNLHKSYAKGVRNCKKHCHVRPSVMGVLFIVPPSGHWVLRHPDFKHCRVFAENAGDGDLAVIKHCRTQPGFANVERHMPCSKLGLL